MNGDFFLFPWRLPHPLLTGVFFFMVPFGLTHLLHKVFKEKSSLRGGFLKTRWVSFWLGDPCLTAYAVFGAYVVGEQTVRGFQSDWWFQLFIFATSLLIFVGQEIFHVLMEGLERLRLALQPSQLTHTFGASFTFYGAVWGFVAIVRDREPLWAFIPAVIFAGGWVLTVIYDNFINPRRKDPITLDYR